MTDRIHSLTLTLAQDVREDDAQALMDACRMLKGVLEVAANVSDPITHMAERRARADLLKKLWDVLTKETHEVTR